MDQIQGKFIPLPLADVDTDMIIPAGYMKSVGKEGYGRYLFERLREADPSFPTNKASLSGAPILVARENFGCGSSREHAVWALTQTGIRVVIAPSFADIFASNASKNGLVTIVVSEDAVEKLLEYGMNQEGALTISFARRVLFTSEGKEYRFEYNEAALRRSGSDDLDYLLFKKKVIEEHFRERSGELFLTECP